MDDHEVPVGHDEAGLIFQSRRAALEQIEGIIAVGLDMSAVLDVVGRGQQCSLFPEIPRDHFRLPTIRSGCNIEC